MRTHSLLLICAFLQCTKGVVAEQCWQGATFSNTIISPDLKSSSILRVPDVSSLGRCAEACCDLSGCDLAWFFQHRCYVLSCQLKENCQPKQRPGTDSYVVFVQRGPAQMLVLQSLVRGQPYSGPWRPLLRPKGAESLKDLGLFDGEHSFDDDALGETDYPEGYLSSEDHRFRDSKDGLKETSEYFDWPSVPGREGLNLSEAGESQWEASPRDSLQIPTKSNLFLRSTAPDTRETVPAPPTDSGPTTRSPVYVTEGLSDSDISQNVSDSILETVPLLQNSTAGPTSMIQMGNPVPSEQLQSVSSTSASAVPSQPVRTLLVSVGDPVEVTLPRNSVELNASVISEPQTKTSETYAYEWSLISYPTGHQGEMEGKHSKSVKLSGLSAGLYAVKVTVTGDSSYGEGFVNVTVSTAGVNQPPRAIASPESQEVTVPTGPVLIDGSHSTDDESITNYYWEEVADLPQNLKAPADTVILRLSDLEPGNYTFRLTVVDSDGLTDSTLATVRANEPVDLPPVANAGPNKTLTLPLNHATLSGGESSDDHGITGYFWTLSSSSRSREPSIEGVRTPLLQLSDLQEGTYTFQLTVTDSTGQESSSNVTVIVLPEKNEGPTAVVGSDILLTRPVNTTQLDGSRSTDDQGIVKFHWEAISGPPWVQIEDADKPVAMATSLGAGRHVFRLTVTDQQGAADSACLAVTVTEAQDSPLVVHTSGSHTLILPNNSLTLRGSVSGADRANVSYLWVRDGQSPAAGDVLYGSERQACLHLANLIEGTYLFQLRVIDPQGRRSTATSSVEVRPDPHKKDEVELELRVAISLVTQEQRDTLVRQLAALLHVVDSDISVRGLLPLSDTSTVLRFCVRGRDGPTPGPQLTRLLRSLLLREKSNFLLFKVLRVDTTMCLLRCSDHGRCDPFTKRCACYPFWMENPVRRFLGDGLSNCEWSVLYVVLSCFMGMILIMSVSWACMCCCKRRRRTKVRKKNKYTILDNMDDQERMELRPKYSLKHRSTEHNSSLMMSESEFDSEQDTIFSRERQDKGKGYANGSAKNGDAFSYHSVDG
ncbi:hypothetical protein GJAV_G00020580 [Gymnothorax javanicus]|nr:hypothetical protein GJAV_G00020580 [Gymnothorax javanicus]